MNKTLPTNIKLFGNPKSKPRYSVEIKNLDGSSISVVDPKATRAMVALMDMNAVIGGAASHYGGPAAFAEIMSAMHGFVFYSSEKKNKNWYELFNLINDAGHCENGLYALKANYGVAGLDLQSLRGFRSIKSPLSGHGEAHLFPEGVLLSNGPLGSSLGQAQGLAMADKLAGIERTTVVAISDGASMEGEAREAFAAIPGFAKSGKLSPFVMLISDNNTKLSGRIDKDSFSMQPTFASLEVLGWKLITLDTGNDLQACYSKFAEAIAFAHSNPMVPVALHLKTIKGIGTKKTAESSSGGHGFPLKSATELNEFIQEIYSGSTVPAEFLEWVEELKKLEVEIKQKSIKSTVPDDKIQVGVSSALVKSAKAGLPVVSITSDLPGSTGVAGFRKEFPDYSFDVGVAESNMISVAAGFSKVGYIPVVDTFAQFGVTKGALPLIMSSLSHAPMICIFSHTGFQDAADGASHQALSYLSMVASIPNVDTYLLSCCEEAESLVGVAIEKFAADLKQNKHPRTSVFFLGRENFPKTYGVKQYSLNQAQILVDNTNKYSKSVTLLAGGSLVPQVLKAADLLSEKGIGSIVVNPVCVNNIDLKTILGAVEKTGGYIVTAEDHQVLGGMGAIVAHALAQKTMNLKIKSLGVNQEFGQSAYNAIELYQRHGIDAESIAKTALKLL